MRSQFFKAPKIYGSHQFDVKFLNRKKEKNLTEHFSHNQLQKKRL